MAVRAWTSWGRAGRCARHDRARLHYSLKAVKRLHHAAETAARHHAPRRVDTGGDARALGGTMLAVASHSVEGHVSRGFEAVREAFAENFARRGELGGACCVYRRRREGRRSLGRYPQQADGRAVGAGHDGRRALGHEGPGGHDPGTRPLPRMARLRGAGGHVLARVRAAREREDHRPPTAGPSGRSVRLRRTGRSECGCGSRPIGGGDGSSQAGMGAWHAAGLSRADPRILRRRAVAPRGSAASQPGSVLSGRNRDASWRGRLHPTPRRASRTLAWPHSHLQDESRCCSGSAPSGSWSRG